MLDQMKLIVQVIKTNTLTRAKERMAYDVCNLLELDGFKCKVVQNGRSVKIVPTEELSDEQLKGFNQLKSDYTHDRAITEKQHYKELLKSIKV